MEAGETFFSPDTIEHPIQPPGGRNLSTYETQLLFNRHELEGKTVLDLGAGPEVKFAKELRQSGINATVVELSPDFIKAEHAQRAQKSMPGTNLVAGLGQALPFEDESFDRIFAFHVDEHITREVFLEIISEMGRVIEKGGQAKLGPTHDIPGEWQPYQAILNNKILMDKLNNYGIEVVKEPIPESILPKARIKDSYSNVFYESGFNIILNKKKTEG